MNKIEVLSSERSGDVQNIVLAKGSIIVDVEVRYKRKPADVLVWVSSPKGDIRRMFVGGKPGDLGASFDQALKLFAKSASVSEMLRMAQDMAEKESS